MDKQELHVHVNHTDIGQDSTDQTPVYCSREEENVTCQRHGCEEYRSDIWPRIK